VIVSVFPASASVALAVIATIAVPTVPDAVAGAAIAGAVFGGGGGWAIVRTVVALAVAFVAPVPSFTVHTMLYVPAEPAAGVPVTCAVRGDGPGV